jgi:hypothetical protein
MEIMGEIVVHAKTIKVPAVHFNIYGLAPLAFMGTKITNPPLKELGIIISLVNCRNKGP